jgi:hypothetical protein
MSRLTQRLDASVGITAGIRFARSFESCVCLFIRLVLGILDYAWRGLMMKLCTYGLVSTRRSYVTWRRGCR